MFILDYKVAAGFCLLAHLFPPRRMSKVKKVATKASISLSKESMIRIVQNHGDVTLTVEKVRDAAMQLKQTIQPYIIVVGSIQDMQQIFVCIDDHFHKVEKFIDAIDLCFKSFFVFNLCYPESSRHLWVLIQNGVYKICNKSSYALEDVSIQHALKLLN